MSAMRYAGNWQRVSDPKVSEKILITRLINRTYIFSEEFSRPIARDNHAENHFPRKKSDKNSSAHAHVVQTS
jgi:hypothetical protein